MNAPRPVSAPARTPRPSLPPPSRVVGTRSAPFGQVGRASGGWRVPAPAGRTLLESLHAAGASLPSSCRNGTCRTCLCRMATGRVSYRIALDGASTDASTLILP